MTNKQGSTLTIPLHNECSPIHSRNRSSCLKNDDFSLNHTTSTAVRDSISRFYTTIDGFRENPLPGEDMNGCFAVRLAQFLIATISENKFSLTSDGCFTRSFYRHCLGSASLKDLAGEINDSELMVIYIKQCLRLMDASGILTRNRRRAGINRDGVTSGTMYHKLFNAFWNGTRWEDLFPSDGESARELRATRGILRDLLLRRRGAVALGTIANEYFELTGFSNRNNIFMISFLDFYFFTWLRHFGMVRYSDDGDHVPVRIAVTDHGRKSLNSY